jgi:hypothetical protein
MYDSLNISLLESYFPISPLNVLVLIFKDSNRKSTNGIIVRSGMGFRNRDVHRAKPAAEWLLNTLLGKKDPPPQEMDVFRILPND